MKLLKDGFGYLEGARWHDGSLWFSDIKEKTIFRMDPSGAIEAQWGVPARPSGLGFTPDGELLAVSMEDSRLIKIDRKGLSTIADLSAIAARPNDMFVTGNGRAYISQFGFDLFGGEEAKPCGIIVVEPNGDARIEGQDLIFPNGLAVTSDGKQLIVAESFAGRISAFDIDADGGLGPRRDFAIFSNPEVDVPDGLCLDSNDAVWVGCPFAGEFRHIDSSGKVINRIAPGSGGDYCVACALGGKDLRTLFMLVADTDVERLGNDWDSTARVECLELDSE